MYSAGQLLGLTLRAASIGLCNLRLHEEQAILVASFRLGDNDYGRAERGSISDEDLLHVAN